MSFEEEYFDVLKSIEGAIVRAYNATPEAHDRQVDKALDGLIRYYNAALKERKPPTLRLKVQEKPFYDTVKAALEAHMSGEGLLEKHRMVTLEEAVKCLKRIQRSIQQMIKTRGGSGTHYLEFVKNYGKRAGG